MKTKETTVLLQRKYMVTHPKRRRERECGRQQNRDGRKVPEILTRNKNQNMNRIVE